MLKTWYGVEVIEIDGKYFALGGWNGEWWNDCWEVVQDEELPDFFNDAGGKANIVIRPMYSDIQNENDGFDIVGYKVV